MRKILSLFAALVCLVLAGCVQVPMSYQPTLQNLETLQASNMAPATVGDFALAPGKPSAIDQSLSVRSATLTSPTGNSFAAFLKDAVLLELRAAGKYDQDSPVVISGLLSENSLEAPMGTGKGILAAKFSVARDGKAVYEKELREKAEWPSAFIGADAIPTAISQYTSLYKKLIGRLFGDEEFRKATQAR